LIHYKYREIVQASARDYGAFPVLGRAGAKTNSEATPLAFQFTESSCHAPCCHNDLKVRGQDQLNFGSPS
jgi:hypothetical protein